MCGFAEHLFFRFFLSLKCEGNVSTMKAHFFAVNIGFLFRLMFY